MEQSGASPITPKFEFDPDFLSEISKCTQSFKHEACRSEMLSCGGPNYTLSFKVCFLTIGVNPNLVESTLIVRVVLVR